MALPVKSFSEFLSEQIAITQSKSTVLLDFTVGSILLSVFEAYVSGVALYLQAQNEQVLAIARLQTSTGSDVDSFIQPFGDVRKSPVPASGLETFARFSSTNVAIIPVGTTVSSSVNNQSYAVIADANNSNFVPSLNAYQIIIGVTSIQIPVVCITAGTIGNIDANLITTLNTGIVGVDTVTNAVAFQNGQDQETDSQVKQRFPLYMASLSKATHDAIASALLSVPDVLRINLVENKTYPANTDQLGFFYAIVDDGTGSPPSPLLEAAAAAANATRGLTIAFSIFPPVILNIDIVVTVKTTPSVDQSQITANINASISQFLFNQGIGGFIPYTFVPNLIYDSLPTNNQSIPNTTFGRDPNILNVTLLTVNGGTVDIQATGAQIFQLHSLTINYV